MKPLIPPNRLATFLKSEMIDLKLFSLDWWSLAHFGSGLFLGFIIEEWWIAAGLIILYELFEILLYGVLFVPETPGNIIQDIIVGMVGYFIIKLIWG